MGIALLPSSSLPGASDEHAGAHEGRGDLVALLQPSFYLRVLHDQTEFILFSRGNHFDASSIAPFQVRTRDYGGTERSEKSHMP